MHEPLYAHQLDGAEWLAARPRAYLGDPPRIGKTRTTIYALDLLAQRVRPLVVCPASAKSHWQREFAQLGWAAREYTVHSWDKLTLGGERLKAELTKSHNALVMDEAHKARTVTAKITKLIAGREGYVRYFPYVWALSGTPIWKHPGDIYPLFAAMFGPTLLEYDIRTRNEWMERFCHFTVDFRQRETVYGTRNDSTLREIIKRCMLRREWAEVGIDVPETQWMLWTLDVVQDADIIHGYERTATITQLLTKILAGEEVTSSALASYRHAIGVAKAHTALPLIRDDLENTNEKIIIFAYHKDILSTLRVGLQNFYPAYVDGSTSAINRTREEQRFQTDPACRVFIGQIHANRESIRLDAADRTILLEPDWTGNTNVQAANRMVSAGKRSRVEFVVVANTLDEAIFRRHVREIQNADRILSRSTEKYA